MLKDEVTNVTQWPMQSRKPDKEGETMVCVFPVYGWAPPEVMLQFIDTWQWSVAPARLYFVAVCGDDTGRTGEVFARHVRRRGLQVYDGFSVTMPNTYVCLPGFDVDDKEVEQLKVDSVGARLEYIAHRIQSGEKGPKYDCHEGALAWTKTYVIGAAFRRWLMKPTKFRCLPGCVGCGKCAQACPLQNITMNADKPVWGHRCAHCLACYHACPKHAVDYAGRTLQKGQYKRFL
jgi:ferredoxin